MNKSNTLRTWLASILLIVLFGLGASVAEAWNTTGSTQNFRGSKTVNQGPRQVLIVADGTFTLAGIIFNNNGAAMDLALRTNCTGTFGAIAYKCNQNTMGNNITQTCPSSMISTQGNLQDPSTFNFWTDPCDF